jgi:hypothetical protein
MESVPIVAVPVKAMTHEVRPGPVALPFALQLIAVGEANVPSAAPVNFRSPAQLALNDPLAAVVVCSVTFHLKSVQVLGDGIRLDDVQLPSSELLPASLGPVRELRRSKAVQPITTLAANAITTIWILFFIIGISASVLSGTAGVRKRDSYVSIIGRTGATEQGGGSEKYTTRLYGFCRQFLR